MKKAYLYPVSANMEKMVLNGYIENFMDYLSPYFNFVNRKEPSSKGIFDLIRYYRNIDCIFLNWIEDVPDKKGGIIQSVFFIFMVYYFKLKSVKIIWTMHNKESHYGSNKWMKRILFSFILHKSDFVITMSKEGLECFKQYQVQNTGKIRYFPHPIIKSFIPFNANPKIDVLVWGTIIPYKGIDKFLQYLHDHSLQNSYRIHIAGKVKPDDYSAKITCLCNDNIRLDNRYIPVDELKNIMSNTKIVLFTYVGDSVLSSGALMETLSYGVDVIAPHVGAFKDAAEEKLIQTFSDYDELIPILNKSLPGPFHSNLDLISDFIEENDWIHFSHKIAIWLN